jgi:ATP-binding cassette subfamily B protein
MINQVVKKIKSIFNLPLFPVFRQADRFDCGPACLKMICQFYKKNFSIEHIRYLCKITPDGVSGSNLINAAEELGFHSIPASINFDVLSKEAPLPCIAFWRDRHYIIIHEVKNDKIYAVDPNYGNIAYEKNEFLRAWHNSKNIDEDKEGIVILLEPSPDFFKQNENDVKSGISTILPYLKNYNKYLTQVFIGLLVGVVIQLALPLITQSLVDKGISFNDLNFVYILLIAQLMLFLSGSMISIFRSWLLLFIGARISMLITSDYLVKLFKKSLSFFDGKTPGDILQRVNESTRIEAFLNIAPENIFSYFNALIFLFILAYYSFKILLIFIIGILIYTFWVWFFMKKREELDFKRFDASSNINSSLIQTVNGIQEVKVNGSEKRHIWEWEKRRVSYYKNAVANLKLSQYQSIGGNIINELKNILITFTAATLVIDGSITLGAMLAIQYIIGQVNAPLSSLVGFFSLLQDAKLSIDRFKEIEFITPEEEILNNKTLLDLSVETDDIIINNLSFSYNGRPDNFILKNINLTIPKGKTTAIVGNSGGGKTTLIKLLLKLYLPTVGEIKIGDKNLNHIDSNKWRESCGTVLQDGYIFSETITNNITESVPYDDVNVERLLNSVRIANIEELINDLPSGFNSMIGPAGSSGRTLSGGQRQRLLIARAIYKNPQFIFFDEATSALDANNERIIVENLKEFNAGKTVIIIAHRLSTVIDADQIVVLDNGEISEIGKHEDLIKQKGKYYKLIKNQLELGN